jgi:hypothetical protein
VVNVFSGIFTRKEGGADHADQKNRRMLAVIHLSGPKQGRHSSGVILDHRF